MNKEKLPEVWLRGPITGIPAELQPVAHALLQAQEEINVLMAGFPDELLWERPAGVASPAFHLQHIVGVIDRMMSYKNEKPLNVAQLTYLENEGNYAAGLDADQLLRHLNEEIEKAISELKVTAINDLTAYRPVGRKKLPSTVIGLLFHMAEHTMRHTGQLLVTVKLLMNGL